MFRVLPMNFFKTVSLCCVHIFRARDCSREHRERAGIDLVRAVERLIDDEHLSCFRILRYCLDAIKIPLEVSPDFTVVWVFVCHSAASLSHWVMTIIGGYGTPVKRYFWKRNHAVTFIMREIRVKLEQDALVRVIMDACPNLKVIALLFAACS